MAEEVNIHVVIRPGGHGNQAYVDIDGRRHPISNVEWATSIGGESYIRVDFYQFRGYNEHVKVQPDSVRVDRWPIHELPVPTSQPPSVNKHEPKALPPGSQGNG